MSTPLLLTAASFPGFCRRVKQVRSLGAARRPPVGLPARSISRGRATPSPGWRLEVRFGSSRIRPSRERVGSEAVLRLSPFFDHEGVAAGSR